MPNFETSSRFAKPLWRILLAALVGAAGALAVQFFHLCLSFAERHITGSDHGLVAAARALSPLRRFATPLCGALAAGIALWLFAHFRSRHPKALPTDYIEGILASGGRLDIPGSLAKCLASIFVVAGGLAVGREGAMILLASLIGSLLARVVAPAEDRPLYMACGAAAGVAAAYHAPAAGAFFALEMILGSVVRAPFGPIIIAASAGLCVTMALDGARVLYGLAVAPALSLDLFFFAPIVSGLAALAGSGFLYAMDAALACSRKSCGRLPLPLRLGVAGAIVGLLSLFVPEVWGNGYSVIQLCLDAPPELRLVLLFLAMKTLAMLASAAGGAPGGFFTPILFLGSAGGLVLAHGLNALFPGSGLSGITLLGMGTVLAATTHAPIMAAFMVCEITGAYAMLPVLLPAAVIASGLSRRLHKVSIYGL